MILPDDTMTREDVLVEAEFCQVQGIIDEMKPKPFKDSLILSVEQRKVLTSWIKGESKQPLLLLHRASRDGWAASNFHSCCDNKGPTIGH